MSYPSSKGEYIEKSTIDYRVNKAKGEKLFEQRDDNPDGFFNYCEKCSRSGGCRFDVSHIESVDSCQKNGYCEKSWDKKNMRVLCRDCHQKYDGLNLIF